ncbi:hypothetical protein M8J76_010536 [Diaphorina citri]|nr:hypothetical protein M8J76_010536 [Diaphorina citri]
MFTPRGSVMITQSGNVIKIKCYTMKIFYKDDRLERYQEAPCPITGEYHGMIPDTDGLCAKLSSDCTSPETMYYTVVDCNAPEIYEAPPHRVREDKVANSASTLSLTLSVSTATLIALVLSCYRL